MPRTPDPVSRRAFLSRITAAGAVLGTGSLLAACGGGGAPTTASACDGYAALSPQDIQARQNFNYVDNSPNSLQNCANCSLYVPPAGEGACGGCQLFAGPVVANGWCSGWAAAPAS
jgi:hypothetical protein